MKNVLSTSLALVIATISAHAQLIDLQSARGSTYNMTGTAVLGETSSDVWVQIPNDDDYVNSVKQTYGTVNDPTYSNGTTPSGATVTFNNIDSFYSGDYAPYAGASNIFGSYMRINPNQHEEFGGSQPNPSIVFSGLKANYVYTLVLYGNDEASNGFNRSFEATVDGQSEYLNLESTAGYESALDGKTDGVTTYDGNYLKFSGLADSGGNLTIDILGLTNEGEVDITGLQLLGVAPEPSTVWLGALGLGMLGALSWRRMRLPSSTSLAV